MSRSEIKRRRPLLTVVFGGAVGAFRLLLDLTA